MSEQKPRKFRAKREISNCNYGDSYTVSFGEIIEMCDSANTISGHFPSRRKNGWWWYDSSDFEEVFEDEKPRERKFICIKDIVDHHEPVHQVLMGEILTLRDIGVIDIRFKERQGTWYLQEWFKEITDGIPTSDDVLFTKDDFNNSTKTDNRVRYNLRIGIDDLVKLRSAFSLDEIITMIEKGIV